MRQVGRRGRPQIGRMPSSSRPRDAQQPHAVDHFVLENFQHAQDALAAAAASPKQSDPSNEDQVSAERDRLHHVRAAAEAAVDDDLGPAVHGRDFRQHVDRTAAVVELAAAVVRYIDPRRRRARARPASSAVAMPLMMSGILYFALKRSTVLPVQRRLEARPIASPPRRGRSAWRCRARGGCSGAVSTVRQNASKPALTAPST